MADSPISDDKKAQHVIPNKGSTEPELLTVDDLLENDSDMPEVQEHAVAAARLTRAAQDAVTAPDPTPGATPVKGSTDDLGRTFDPALHVAGADGKPTLNRQGFLAKRRGGASKSKTASKSKVDTKHKAAGDGSVPPNPENIEANIQQTAQVASALFLTCAQMVGGEEFAPIVDNKTGENEPQVIRESFANYFRSAGIIDIPPGVALAIGLSFYVVKRWNQPKFTERRQNWFGGVRRWWSDFRLRRKMAREERNRVDDGAAKDGSPAEPSAN